MGVCIETQRLVWAGGATDKSKCWNKEVSFAWLSKACFWGVTLAIRALPSTDSCTSLTTA